MAVVLYPGSFDPPHNGHIDVINQALELFAEVVVAALYNPEKHTGLFTLEERIRLLEQLYGHTPHVRVIGFPGLAVDAAKSVGAIVLVKGLRNAADFDIEQQMAQTNFAVSGIRTIYVPCAPEHSYISSRFVREIAQYGGDVSAIVPELVESELRLRFPLKGDRR